MRFVSIFFFVMRASSDVFSLLHSPWEFMAFVFNYECADFSVILLKVEQFVFEEVEKSEEWNRIDLF